MKPHHPWKESVNEKTHFIHAHFIHEQHHMNITQHNTDGHYSANNSHRPVTFYCAAPQAREVSLAGDFNHWHPFPMTRSVDGWWQVQVELPHGHHQYRFIVDGEPMLDPHAMGIVRNEHNERVSLIAVS